MANHIYKYKIELTEEQRLDLPSGATFLDVQYVGADLCVWVIHDFDRDIVSVPVKIRGTGPEHSLEGLWGNGYRHLGTVQDTACRVWHAFVENYR